MSDITVRSERSKTETSQENFSDEEGRGREEEPSQERKKEGEKRERGGIELKLKGGKERLMSVLQQEVFRRQPTLDCQLTELPIQASQKRNDKRADVLLEYLEI